MLAGARFVAADYAGSGAIFWSDGIRLVQANNTPTPLHNDDGLRFFYIDLAGYCHAGFYLFNRY